MADRLSFRCARELIELVDAKRGLVPRETWLRDVVQKAAISDDDDADSEQVRRAAQRY